MRRPGLYRPGLLTAPASSLGPRSPRAVAPLWLCRAAGGRNAILPRSGSSRPVGWPHMCRCTTNEFTVKDICIIRGAMRRREIQ